MKDNRFMKVINDADKKGTAVGAVNIVNYLTTDAAVTAAQELGVDLIIQTSAGTVEHFGAKKLYDMIDAVRKNADITVAIHLDHCRKTELGKACVDAGWDAVMMDFSHLPLEENIARTKEVAIYAHERGVAIEGEIGVIYGVEEDIEAANDIPFKSGDRVAVMINGMGGTPISELYIAYREAALLCEEAGFTIAKNYVGNYCTSLEMAGFSLTILQLDDEIEELLNEPAEIPIRVF